GARFGQHLLGGLYPLRLQLRPEALERRQDIQVRIPDIEERLLREGPHRRAVSPDACQHNLPACLAREAVIPARHYEARGEALDIPLERSGQRLVEVVDVEDKIPLW